MADEISQSTDSSIPDEGSFNNFIGPYATCTSVKRAERELRACLFVRQYFADWKCSIRFFA